VPARALEWTLVPPSSFPRNEGVPGSSPRSALKALLRGNFLEPLSTFTSKERSLGAGLSCICRNFLAPGAEAGASTESENVHQPSTKLSA
jgi:hypothetical protein